ncbi:MAG: hypothetical protein RLZZ115_2740, partial [Cyanobacteriota bacterium]
MNIKTLDNFIHTWGETGLKI